MKYRKLKYYQLYTEPV